MAVDGALQHCYLRAEARLGDVSDSRKGVVGESQPIADSTTQVVRQPQTVTDLYPDTPAAHHLPALRESPLCPDRHREPE